MYATSVGSESITESATDSIFTEMETKCSTAPLVIRSSSITCKYVMLCYVMICYVMLCYVMSCYVMLCYVMLCYITSCYNKICYAMLCYVMSNHIKKYS